MDRLGIVARLTEEKNSEAETLLSAGLGFRTRSWSSPTRAAPRIPCWLRATCERAPLRLIYGSIPTPRGVALARGRHKFEDRRRS